MTSMAGHDEETAWHANQDRIKLRQAAVDLQLIVAAILIKNGELSNNFKKKLFEANSLLSQYTKPTVEEIDRVSAILDD